MAIIPTSQDNYKELFLLYYNTVVDILKVYRYRDENNNPLSGDDFLEKVEDILIEKKIID